METPIEAYEFTMKMLEKLKEHGIKVKMTPSRSRNSASALEKYGGLPDRIPSHLWFHTNLLYETPEQKQKIFEMTRYLGMAGISFDTGGCCVGDGVYQFDWETDWSFRFQKGKEDWERMEALDWLEDILPTETK